MSTIKRIIRIVPEDKYKLQCEPSQLEMCFKVIGAYEIWS